MENLAKAIINVIKSVKNIEKNLTVGEGRNSYKGVGDADVKNIIGKAMADNGLCILPISVEPTVKVERWETQYNGQPVIKQQVFTEAKTKYLLLHESGESQVIEGYGHGVDSQDKSAGKATTYALKYALLYSFLVPTGDIDDSDTVHSDNHQTPPKQVKQTAKPASQQQAAKQELYPGLLDKWNAAKDFIKNYDEGSVFDALDSIKKKYTLSEANEKLLVKEAKGIEINNDDPLEAIDAIKTANDMATLNKTFNECSALHTNKAFVEAYAARQKELAKLGKAA